MEFKYRGKDVIVKGEQKWELIPHPSDSQCSLSEVGFQGLILGFTQLQLQLMAEKETEEESKASTLQHLLYKFEQVFEEPRGLPPI